jgi:ATP-binding cassette subfamily B protein/subfamily B ATP-binding cassette protein MsbA
MRRYLKILRYAWPHRWLFAAIFGLTLGVSALAILQPLPGTWVIDSLLKPGYWPEALGRVGRWLFDGEPSMERRIGFFVVLGLVFYGLNTLFDAALSLAWTVAGRRVVNGLMLDLFERLQRRSLLYHARNAVGDSLSRVMADSWCAHTLLETLLFAPLLAVLTIAGMIVLMGASQPVLTIIALAVAPLMVAASCIMGERLRGASLRRRDIETKIQSHVQQVLSGMPIVQAFVQEPRELAQFRRETDEGIRAQQQTVLLSSMGGFGSGLVTTLGTGIILWVGARYVLAGQLTVGGLWLFLRYLTVLQTHVKALAAIYPGAQSFRASVDRIIETLETQPEIPERPNVRSPEKVTGHIRLESVTCGYDSGRPILRDISLEAEPGGVTAIIGATGTGKSTLVSLIPRLMDPWEGRVRLDGTDVRDLPLGWLRSQVAMVLQEPCLFSWSVADNIAYGRPGATRQEIEQAARAANAHEFIVRLPQGYDTLLGERGAALSGGERQRLSISRAILKDAPILILDEPTSALDAQTEAMVMEALERLLKGRTTFVIAHRLSTIRRAGQILVLRDGRIHERGNHETLLRQGGDYARFYTLQNPVSASVPALSLTKGGGL